MDGARVRLHDGNRPACPSIRGVAKNNLSCPTRLFQIPNPTLGYDRLQLTEDLPELPAREDGEPRVEEGVGGRRSSLLPSGQSDNCTRQVVLPAGPGQGLMAVRVLDELDLGKLMLLVHQVRVDGRLSAFDLVASHLREVQVVTDFSL